MVDLNLSIVQFVFIFGQKQSFKFQEFRENTFERQCNAGSTAPYEAEY